MTSHEITFYGSTNDDAEIIEKNENKKINLLWCEYILFPVIVFPICLDFGHSSQLGTNCLFLLFGQQKLMPNNL